jgi:hypothetical protein
MPDTRKRVKIVSDHPGYPPGSPVVLVDGEPLRCVSRIKLDHEYSGGLPTVELTLIGVDVDLDLDATPDYLVKVVGPAPAMADNLLAEKLARARGRPPEAVGP